MRRIQSQQLTGPHQQRTTMNVINVEQGKYSYVHSDKASTLSSESDCMSVRIVEVSSKPHESKVVKVCMVLMVVTNTFSVIRCDGRRDGQTIKSR